MHVDSRFPLPFVNISIYAIVYTLSIAISFIAGTAYQSDRKVSGYYNERRDFIR